MANLKEVRERISSVVTTQQITKAMKLVAASKLKRAQDSITQMRPYSQVLSNMLENVMANLDGVELDLGLNRSVDNPKRGLLIVMTSDRGLCGAFNANLMKQAKEVMASNSAIRYFQWARKPMNLLKEKRLKSLIPFGQTLLILNLKGQRPLRNSQ